MNYSNKINILEDISSVKIWRSDLPDGRGGQITCLNAPFQKGARNILKKKKERDFLKSNEQ